MTFWRTCSTNSMRTGLGGWTTRNLRRRSRNCSWARTRPSPATGPTRSRRSWIHVSAPLPRRARTFLRTGSALSSSRTSATPARRSCRTRGDNSWRTASCRTAPSAPSPSSGSDARTHMRQWTSRAATRCRRSPRVQSRFSTSRPPTPACGLRRHTQTGSTTRRSPSNSRSTWTTSTSSNAWKCACWISRTDPGLQSSRCR
mmetsp:Transcript_44430/g.105965  ORF Transcript_44430/g.105965 Transcript_44430/m.105965 type:complete len:201 (+) Transcript_44430:585-1187(+)